MKRIFWLILFALITLAAVLYIRAELTFKDTQVKVDSPQNTLTLFDRAAALQRFAVAIKFPTISYDDISQFDPAPFINLRAHIEASFPKVHQVANQIVINNYSLVYEFIGSDPSLKPALFMGHMDVVPVDEATREQWLQPPFSGAIVDDVVWGRGTIDDKVTVLALMEAMETALSQGFSPKRSIYFAFGHDEEIGGEQGAKQIAEYFKQKQVQFEFVLDEGGAITDGLMAGFEQPVAIVGVAEKGFVNVRLTVNSEGGHSSQPPDHTGVGILAQALVNIEKNQFDTDLSYSYKTFESVGYYAPLSSRLPMANLWLFSPIVEQVMLKTPSSAAGIRSTIAATMFKGSSKSNILPTQTEAVVNVRIMPEDSVASVKQHMLEAIDDPRVKVDTFMANEPSEVSPTDSLGFSLIERNIRQLDNQVLVAPYLVMGGTDSKHFYGLSENVYRFMMVRFDKNSLKRFHGVNEQLAGNEYMKAVEFFYAMLEQTGSGANL